MSSDLSRRPSVTLAQLTYVVAVDEHRHFSRAAERCRVTQPTLSTQLAKLERELGVEIFDRSRRPVEPTDLGRRVVAQARTVLRGVARIDELVREARGRTVGELRVGVLPTLAPYLLPRFVSELARSHRGLSLTVEERMTEAIVRGIEHHDLDAGLVATPVDQNGLVGRALFREPFLGYVSSDHRLAARDRIRREDLSLEDLWILHRGHCFRDQVLELCEDLAREDGGARPLSFESGNVETLRRLVDQSGGMTLLPGLAVSGLDDGELERVRPFTDPAPSRTVRLVHGKTYLKRALIDAFVGELLEAVPGSWRRGAAE